MAEREPNAHQFTLDDALGADTTGFMNLEDPNYAYMFGFLQADGHLSAQSRQRGRLTVEINAQDIDLLREFQKLTPYNSSITERTRSTDFAATHHSAVWSLHSLEARTKLNELGLPYGRKSKTIAPPRGEFSGRDYLRGDVTSAERIIKRNTRDSIYNVLYMMEVAQNLAAHLYYPGCLSLERKRTAANSLATWVRPAGMRSAYTQRRWTEWEDRVLLALGNDAAAADELGRTEKSCHMRLWRLHTGQLPMPGDQ